MKGERTNQESFSILKQLVCEWVFIGVRFASICLSIEKDRTTTTGVVEIKKKKVFVSSQKNDNVLYLSLHCCK